MKRFTFILVVLALIAGQHAAFAQNRGDSGFTEEGKGIPGSGSSGSGAAASQTLFHLLILDRVSAVDSDVSGIGKDSLLYKAKHGQTGYLIVLYEASQGSSSVSLPANSHIVLDLVTNRKSTIREFIDSPLIKDFVTEASVLTRLREAINL
jgi:hypothetical protein